MGLASILPATVEHAAAMAPLVRPEDRQELWASVMQRPLNAMLSGVKYSEEAATGFVDGEPVAMWGVVRESFIGNIGVPWMVATELLDKHARTFIRHCRGPVLEMMGKFDTLQNYVDARNKRAIQWLQWVGFNVEDEAAPFGMLGLPFHKFTMNGSVLPCAHH